eukprot:c28954_g1_i1 orf=3-206(-)
MKKTERANVKAFLVDSLLRYGDGELKQERSGFRSQQAVDGEQVHSQTKLWQQHHKYRGKAGRGREVND